jgi:hypothetical protein
VHVPDGLPAVLAGVEYDPVSAVGNALGGRDLVCRADDFVEKAAARGGEGRHVGEMIPGHHQNVRRRLRVDVTEGDGPLSVHHYRGRDLSGSYPAEQAVWHTSIIVAAGRARRPTVHRENGWSAGWAALPRAPAVLTRPAERPGTRGSFALASVLCRLSGIRPNATILLASNNRLLSIRDRSGTRKGCLVSGIAVILASSQSAVSGVELPNVGWTVQGSCAS